MIPVLARTVYTMLHLFSIPFCAVKVEYATKKAGVLSAGFEIDFSRHPWYDVFRMAR